MAKQKDFDDFLHNIEPGDSTKHYVSSIQSNLREYLRTHELYRNIHVDTFLSGSYAKHTAIRPVKDDKKRDVDIIVVTAYGKAKDSRKVLDELCEVLKASKSYASATVQHHSVGVEMGQVSVDVVPVINNVVDGELYFIGDSKLGNWIVTDPKGHKSWSTSVNQDNNEKYKPLVKIFKWWRRENCPKDRKYPKGITLEKLIADNLGDSTLSTEDFLIETMEKIVSAYKEAYADKGIVPTLDDPSEKTRKNNLLEGYSPEDFSAFIYKLDEHLKLINDEGTENETWRKILGDVFPRSASKKYVQNMLMCKCANHRQRMPWLFARGGAVFITAQIRDKDGNKVMYENNGDPLEKGCSLKFRACTGVKPPFIIKWQITNTGEEAGAAGCLRGYFEDSDEGNMIKNETTRYKGSHSVQCFVIKNGICVAKSNALIINIL